VVQTNIAPLQDPEVAKRHSLEELLKRRFFLYIVI